MTTVEFGGRTFTVGVWYRPKPENRRDRARRRIVSWSVAHEFRLPIAVRVQTESQSAKGRDERWCGQWWLDWAGDEVQPR